MLWHKSWLDTRWRFLIGLGLLVCSAFLVVAMYPRAVSLLSQVPQVQFEGEIGRRVSESLALVRSYHGYLLSQWFHQTPLELGTFFAILLGSGGLFSHGSSGRLFTLSLPVSRNDILTARAAIGLAEWLVLSFAPSLLLPLLSPSVGETFSLSAALAHGLCLFVGGAAFFSLSLLLSTLFDDVWRPLLIAITLALAVSLAETLVHVPPPHDALSASAGMFRVMSGDSFFYIGQLPWLGLFGCAALSALMLWTAAANLARRDF